MTRGGLWSRATIAALVVVFSIPLLPSRLAEVAGLGRARAAEYRLSSEARYTVRPAAGVVEVRVDFRFRNTTPNPPGQFSVFDTVDLGLQPGARQIQARDRKGSLRVKSHSRQALTSVRIRLRQPIRYREDARFRLTYRLPDRAEPQIRVQPSLAIVPVWSFGTSGQVELTLPDGFEVRLAGDRMRARTAGAGITLLSGSIDDPQRWLAQITASRPSSYTTLDRSLTLGGDAVALHLNAWRDDPAWGRRVADTLVRGLPLVDEYVGRWLGTEASFSSVDVTESAPPAAASGTLGEEEPATSAPGSRQLLVAFDARGFEILHQAAHLWLSPELVADRWIREGFATDAALAAIPRRDIRFTLAQYGLDRTERDDAFPLISWGHGPTSQRQNAYAYAASWDTANMLRAATGPDVMRLAWQRMAAGVPAYEPADAPIPSAGPPPVPTVDSRTLLDQLQQLSDAPVEQLLRDRVFDRDALAQLDERREARRRYAELEELAGGWGTPQPIRADMTAWRFGEAKAGIEAASAWLRSRDELMTAIGEAGLSAPRRLEEAYETSGGEEAADQELAAERDVVAGYREALAAVGRPQGVIERLGLIGASDPSALLAQANRSFAEGDLLAATDLIQEARSNVASATTNGIVRIGSVVALVVGVLALAFVLARRRRGKDYTARP